MYLHASSIAAVVITAALAVNAELCNLVAAVGRLSS